MRKITRFLFLSLMPAMFAACSVSETKVDLASGPSGVQAAAGNGAVTLTWSGMTGMDSYRVYWNTSGGVSAGNATAIQTVSGAPYTHEGLANGQTYFYRVTGVTSGGVESPMSDEVSATPTVPRASAPSSVQATGGDGAVTLSWDAVAGADYYMIYWNTTGGVSMADRNLTATSTSYTHDFLDNGVTYYYRLTSVNGGGESDMSTELHVTPSASGGSTGGTCVAVPDHSGSVIWTTADCGPYAYGSGQAYQFSLSGAPTMTNGKLSFKVTGLSDSILPSGRDFFLMFAKMTTPSGAEGNFQIDLFIDGAVNSRFISQRFDGTCSSFCERQNIHTEVSWNGSATYKFEFEWNSSTVYMLVTDASSGATVMSGSLPTDGAYVGADYIRVGNGALSGYSGVGSTITVSELRLSVLQ
ncbi:MAG: fibronectin type III domain-containing protein [Nitrospinae bacterium]|nr:fibronectin type III domain-containing protein [Nitrospinota bacterium]